MKMIAGEFSRIERNRASDSASRSRAAVSPVRSWQITTPARIVPSAARTGEALSRRVRRWPSGQTMSTSSPSMTSPCWMARASGHSCGSTRRPSG
jgi:hypothetical protein